MPDPDTASDSVATSPIAETIARQVMSDTLGVPFEECSAQSMGAQMIREGIKRFAATPDAVNADKAVAETVYEVDDRGLFCKHCGRATWLHHRVKGVGLRCTPPAPDKALMPEAAVGGADTLSEAVRTIFGRCEALADEASDELAKGLEDHAAGFYRGQKSTAKSLRDHLHDMTRFALTTPAPVEEPEKGATGEAFDRLAVLVERVFNPYKSVFYGFKGNWQNDIATVRAALAATNADHSPDASNMVDTATAATNAGQVEAMNDPKYDFREGRIFNRASGQAVPADEPAFVFRARDRHAVEALIFYQSVCHDPEHRDVIGRRIDDFEKFARTRPERMKEPDTAALKANGDAS